MFGNPKGELRICSKCKREHDILRGTRCWCACGEEIRSKECFSKRNVETNKLVLQSCKTCEHLEGCTIELLNNNIKPEEHICENWMKQKEESKK